MASVARHRGMCAAERISAVVDRGGCPAEYVVAGITGCRKTAREVVGVRRPAAVVLVAANTERRYGFLAVTARAPYRAVAPLQRKGTVIKGSRLPGKHRMAVTAIRGKSRGQMIEVTRAGPVRFMTADAGLRDRTLKVTVVAGEPSVCAEQRKGAVVHTGGYPSRGTVACLTTCGKIGR